MKTKKTRVPQFDEIIFENRNKTYGAYDLRKRYKSTKSLSVLFAVTLAVSLVTALFLKSDDGIASGGETQGIIVYVDPVKPPDFVEPEVVKPPEELMKNVIRNLKPEITEDTGRVSDYIPTNQEIIDKIPNGNVTDTLGKKQVEDPVIDPEPEQPRVFVEEMPEFPGGSLELLKFIANHIQYPEEAIANGIQGNVILRFVVNADGSVDRSEVMRGVDVLLDNEAIRVMGTVPKFRPGKQNGVPVPVWFTIPVVFQLK